MKTGFPFKIWFWLIQPLLFVLSACFLSLDISTTPRSPFATPTFSFIFGILMFWGGIVKLPIMIAQFLLVRSALWLRCNGLLRGLMIYFLDLLVSIMAVAALLQVWINTLFIDAGFPALMILFPYNILSGLLAAILSPAPSTLHSNDQQDTVNTPESDPRLIQLVTGIIFFITFIATLLLTTSTASNHFELLGQTLAFFPLLLLVFRVYFIPVHMMMNRSPHKTMKILLINLLLGWTLIGWISCLLWAYRSPRTIDPTRPRFIWRILAGWLVTAFGMMLTGVGISVLGEQLGEISESRTGSIVAPIVILILSLAVTGFGARLITRPVTPP